jgi:hypothetical protein
VAFFLNLFFVFVEVAGGLLTNSFAILSDAIHDFGDCVAIGFAYIMERLSEKAPDEKFEDVIVAYQPDENRVKLEEERLGAMTLAELNKIYFGL